MYKGQAASRDFYFRVVKTTTFACYRNARNKCVLYMKDRQGRRCKEASQEVLLNKDELSLLLIGKTYRFVTVYVIYITGIKMCGPRSVWVQVIKLLSKVLVLTKSTDPKIPIQKQKKYQIYS